jgi:hypothetical protein
LNSVRRRLLVPRYSVYQLIKEALLMSELERV